MGKGTWVAFNQDSIHSWKTRVIRIASTSEGGSRPEYHFSRVSGYAAVQEGCQSGGGVG